MERYIKRDPFQRSQTGNIYHTTWPDQIENSFLWSSNDFLRTTASLMTNHMSTWFVKDPKSQNKKLDLNCSNTSDNCSFFYRNFADWLHLRLDCKQLSLGLVSMPFERFGSTVKDWIFFSNILLILFHIFFGFPKFFSIKSSSHTRIEYLIFFACFWLDAKWWSYSVDKTPTISSKK